MWLGLFRLCCLSPSINTLYQSFFGTRLPAVIDPTLLSYHSKLKIDCGHGFFPCYLQFANHVFTNFDSSIVPFLSRFLAIRDNKLHIYKSTVSHSFMIFNAKKGSLCLNLELMVDINLERNNNLTL